MPPQGADEVSPRSGVKLLVPPAGERSLPLEGSAVLNDRPVACQIRGPTDPQGDRWHGEAVTDEVSLVPRPARRRTFNFPGGVSRHQPKPPEGRLWRDLIIAKTVRSKHSYRG